MSNFHTLTKRIDHQELIAEMITEGVTCGIAIDHEKIYMTGAVWDAMDGSARTAELAMVSTAEAAHVPTTCTLKNLTSAPHIKKLLEECSASTGVTNMGIEFPSSYPGDIIMLHNSLSSGDQTTLGTTAADHDASTIPSLAIDTATQVIAANNSDTGTVVITDSRGASANGNTVKIKIPSGGGADIDGDSYTLAGVGQATVTFQATTVFTGELEFEAYYADDSADPITFKVRRGTA